MTTTLQLPPRADIAPQHTWNAESVFPTVADWEAACDAIPALLDNVTSYQGRLAESPATLAAYWQAAETLMRAIGRITAYTTMASSVDTGNQQASAMASRARSLSGRAMAAVAFAEPELLALGQAALNAWLDADPALASRRHYLDNLFRRAAHVRSAEVEEIIGLISDPFSTVAGTYGMLTSADLTFRPAVGSDGQEQPVAQGTLATLLSSPDRELRRTAWESFTDGHLAFKNTLASNLMGSVKQDVFRARVRRHSTALEASLFASNIPVAVFQNLIDTYRQHLPTWHKYWAVRRKILGTPDLHPYDVWAPLTETQPEVPYTQAVDWICAGMQPLGDDYVTAMRRGCLDDRWVDIYPNQGKRAGAFSSGAHDTFPFILMSYNNTLGAMSTLAHELGHSMHSYLARSTQPPVYSGYSLFVAEVASNFNQAMTRAYLFDAYADDPAFQINVIEEAMSNFHRYFFIMPTLARFELEVHTRAEQGRGVTADDLNALMADLFAEGYGAEVHVDPARTGITWAQFGHLYSAYYVYQYATGISAAHALAAPILAGEAGAADRYLDFLRAGSSLYPLDALSRAGVEMTSPHAVEVTFGVLADYVKRLEALA